MTFQISKTFEFSAHHRLESLPSDHPCRRDHGHNYKVTVTLAAEELDEHGMVTDYANLEPVGRHIRKALDHRSLNDVLADPTAERVAQFLYVFAEHNLLPLLGLNVGLVSVTVKETDQTSASYYELERVGLD